MAITTLAKQLELALCLQGGTRRRPEGHLLQGSLCPVPVPVYGLQAPPGEGQPRFLGPPAGGGALLPRLPLWAALGESSTLGRDYCSCDCGQNVETGNQCGHS